MIDVETDDLTDLMTPEEVAALFRVTPRTVWQWARAGRISCIKTPGGTRRYLRAEVNRLLADARTGGM